MNKALFWAIIAALIIAIVYYSDTKTSSETTPLPQQTTPEGEIERVTASGATNTEPVLDDNDAVLAEIDEAIEFIE